MSLSRAQQILAKRAQAQAGLPDSEYREAISQISGLADCRSSKDARLTDAHLDALLSYFEAIHWRKVDAGELSGVCKADAPFRQRGFWAGRNGRGNTSRDRYTAVELGHQIQALEEELYALGFGLAYLTSVQNRIEPFSLVKYLGALQRTVNAKRSKVVSASRI